MDRNACLTDHVRVGMARRKMDYPVQQGSAVTPEQERQQHAVHDEIAFGLRADQVQHALRPDVGGIQRRLDQVRGIGG